MTSSKNSWKNIIDSGIDYICNFINNQKTTDLYLYMIIILDLMIFSFSLIQYLFCFLQFL